MSYPLRQNPRLGFARFGFGQPLLMQREVPGYAFIGEPSAPAGPVFRLECPTGCAPIAAAQCRAVLRRAIVAAIFLADNAASKLEASPRDSETVRLFRFFFGHDPSRPVPWADNRESGASVARRLRTVAEALRRRGVLFRCNAACSAGVIASANAGVDPNRITLCAGFWNPPAGLPLSAEAFRAGVIIHEMLHLLYHQFFHHAGHPSGDPERRRDNAHCYNNFAWRVAGHGAVAASVAQCTGRPV